MNCNEKYYRKVMGSIGLTMLLFLGLFNVFGVAIALLYPLLTALNVSPIVETVVYELVYGAVYTLSFMLPVLLLKGLLGKSGYTYIPMQTSMKGSPWIFLAFPAGLALIYAASYVNMAMVGFFDFSGFFSDALWENTATGTEPYEIVLQFIVLCAVPGFCEEFLFRGAIMTNCMPFGRTNAVLISAFLFAMMHQNPGQIFYTFVAGIFLAILYDKTGSIWPGTFVHIFNNFSSVMLSVILEKHGYSQTGVLLSTVFEIVVFALGFLSLAILVLRGFSHKEEIANGFFEKELLQGDGYAAYPVAPKRAVKLFFTPSMIVFLIFAALQTVALILLAVIYGIFA